MTIYLLRHGQTDANLGKVVDDRVDTPLNATGVAQAEKVRGELSAVEFVTIYSSPLQRARRTAEIVNQPHDLLIQTDARICERNVGHLFERGGTHDNLTWAGMFNADNEIIVPGSETLREFFGRVYNFIDDLKSKYRDEQNILVVAHGGVQHAFYAYFNRLPLSGDMRIDKLANGEYRKYNFNEEEK